ncbi:ankyrin repeat SOCS box 3 [Fusarium heterosporum]|uniref:Ankyrin repeat SOCS box 3 n=1 Tax=Fusarium heterosporum TaxID=42747 RepID=A0A8H5T6H7_FUSHE|nr:ankyrin repeat SOCS box 3 [Fusarium heterosporum]
MPPTKTLNSKSIIRWIDMVLETPEEHYDDEHVVKLNRNIFVLDDFETHPRTRGPVFNPLSSCIIYVTPLSAAAYCGYEKAVKTLLKFPNPHNHHDNVWCSPLSLAYVSKHFGIINILKEANMECDESGNPFTIMHAAARNGSPDYVRYLHTHRRVEMTIQDVDGITPAIHALYQDGDDKVKDMISTIIEFDKQAMDIGPVWINDWTCADLAHAMGRNKELVEWLRQMESECTRSGKADRLNM